MPRRVTGTFLGSAFEQHGYVIEDGIDELAKMVGKALRSDRTFKRASNVKPRKVAFLWNPYLPLRVVSLLGGVGGVGKSTVALRLAAIVSNGDTFPNGWKSRNGEPANVLIMSAEDPLEEVLQPRLVAAGADLERITLCDFELDESLTLDAEGLAIIERQIEEHKPKLVCLDPIVHFMGDKLDMNRANEIRPIMQAGYPLRYPGSALALVMRRFLW